MTAVSISHSQARKKFAVGKLIALTGPEIGVGRSVCAVSIAISLAQRWRCLALDLDTGTRALQTYFGLQAANVGISEFLENPANSLETIQTRTRVTNLDCIGWSAAGGKPVALGPQRIDSLLRCMQSHPADYVFATLPAGTTEDTLELFTSADIPILVTPSTPALLEKVVEFLRHCASAGLDSRCVYLLVNRVQRGGEVREASELVEKARESLGLNVSILGTIQYDHQLEASFRPGSALSVQRSQKVTALAFEDIALRIERLLPRGRLDTATGADARKTRRAPNGNLRDAVMTSFGGKAKLLQEQLRQRDEAVRRLQHQHQSAIGELQQIIQNKNDEIAGNNVLIRELEEKNQLYRGDLSERAKEISQLEDAATALLAEKESLERERNHVIQKLEEAGFSLAEVQKHKNQEIQDLSRRFAQLTAFTEELKTALGQKNAQLVKQVEDLEATVGVQRNEIGQLRHEIGELKELNDAISAENAGSRRDIDEIRLQRDETVRRLDEAEARAHEQKRVLEEKDHTIHHLAERLAQLNAEHQRLSTEVMETVRHLSEEMKLQVAAQHATTGNEFMEFRQQLMKEIQSQRDEMVGGLAEVEKSVRDRDALLERKDLDLRDHDGLLKRKDQEIQGLAERLAELTSEQGMSANRVAEILQQLSGEIQLHRHQTMRGLVEAEGRVKDRDLALAHKDESIHELEQCVDMLTSGQNAAINRTTETLQRLSREIQVQRDELASTIESCRSLVSGSEKRADDLVAQLHDAARQKETVVRQMESALRQEISELLELQKQKGAVIDQLEKRVRVLDEENHQLSFDLMTSKAAHQCRVPSS